MISICINRCFATLCLLAMLSACGSSSNSSSGTDIVVRVSHEAAALPAVTMTATPGKAFINDKNTLIEITEAYLTVSEMDIRSDCISSPFAFMFNKILDIVIPVAVAHSTTTPTTIGDPLVLDMMTDDDTSEKEFGNFSPAADTYCGVTVHAHPADSDTRDLPPVAFTGLVLHVAGNYTPDGGVTIAFMFEITTDLDHADIALPTDIVLSSAKLTGDIDLNIEYNTWFEGIDVTKLVAGNTTQRDQFSANITASIKHH